MAELTTESVPVFGKSTQISFFVCPSVGVMGATDRVGSPETLWRDKRPATERPTLPVSSRKAGGTKLLAGIKSFRTNDGSWMNSTDLVLLALDSIGESASALFHPAAADA